MREMKTNPFPFEWQVVMGLHISHHVFGKVDTGNAREAVLSNTENDVHIISQAD